MRHHGEISVKLYSEDIGRGEPFSVCAIQRSCGKWVLEMARTERNRRFATRGTNQTIMTCYTSTPFCAPVAQW
jgi:hypothetical protein